MKKLFGKRSKEEHDFWMSYTDLMSGFLIVFIVASYVYQSRFNTINSMIQNAGCTVKDVEEMLKWHKEHGNLVNINDDFKDVFEGIEGVEFVKEEGSIRIYPTYATPSDNMLFKVNSDVMEPNLSERISLIGQKFVQKAMELKNEGKNIAEVRIEGHTDPSGYFFGINGNGNLMLSSKRAYTVFKAIFDCCQTQEEKQFVFDNMISVGYSSQKPIPDKKNPNFKRCRRIEFRIISK